MVLVVGASAWTGSLIIKHSLHPQFVYYACVLDF